MLRIADGGSKVKYLYMILNFPHRIVRTDMNGQNQAGTVFHFCSLILHYFACFHVCFLECTPGSSVAQLSDLELGFATFDSTEVVLLEGLGHPYLGRKWQKRGMESYSTWVES